MSDRLRIALAQSGFMVGDVRGNAQRIVDLAREARERLAADCVVFPELALTGYPPEDLLLRPGFLREVESGLHQVCAGIRDIDAIVGVPILREGRLYNAAVMIHGGEPIAVYRKQHLPNYSVFDEKRYFDPGAQPCVVDIRGWRAGLTVCEDMWQPGPVEQAAVGADFVININASPWHLGKRAEREDVLRRRIGSAQVPVIYVNTVAGQDELVFDGQSFVMDAHGTVTQRAPAWEEALVLVELEAGPDGRAIPVPATVTPTLSEEESVYRALVLGVRQYVDRNNFEGVVVGLSGGLDSALTLAIAVDALGARRVEALMLPSRFTAKISREDAAAEARALGVLYREISIEPAFETFLDSLRDEFAGLPPDVTEENIQARCRGVILMAVANKKRRMVLTTGNKSEMAVGYATLYGDMAGGFAPIKDVPKTMVYRLARYRNGLGQVIPQRVLERPPSAELAPGQLDQDTLPPYPVLDAILEMYVERDMAPADIVAAGHDAEVVRRTVTMIDRNEYKRRQAPPGVRISRRAFGRDRRYPITSGFRSYPG
ncbi:MAG: NAD+ synthase [Gammaproteobacteria bacterium]|jgi:NAD+ synthase (glutamine-hydrolysing)|nr:NAD+ synthase [Gammaproteobacteria bacterium]